MLMHSIDDFLAQENYCWPLIVGMANAVIHLRWGRKSDILVVAQSSVSALLGSCRQGVWLPAP